MKPTKGSRILWASTVPGRSGSERGDSLYSDLYLLAVGGVDKDSGDRSFLGMRLATLAITNEFYLHCPGALFRNPQL